MAKAVAALVAILCAFTSANEFETNNTNVSTETSSIQNEPTYEIQRDSTVLNLSQQLLNLTRILDQGTHTVEVLNATLNQVHSLEERLFSAYPKLRILDLSHNPVNNLEILKSFTVEELRLSYSQLQWVRIAHLRGLSKLKSLYLDNSRHLTWLELYAPSLEILDASHCSLTEVARNYLPNIRAYNVSHNRITHIEEFAFEGVKLLQTLDLSYNDITHIDDYAFIRTTSLKFLDLSHNNLITIDWSMALKSVTILNVSRNYIDSIDTLILRGATHIDVSYNRLKSLPQEISRLLPKVEILVARGNPIREIGQLKSNTLKDIHLEECKIDEMSEAAFRGTPQLQTLDVTDNKLQSLSFLSEVPKACKVFLEENPWACDCSSPTPAIIVCQPSNLSIADFCEIQMSQADDKAWYMEATNPIIWAPLLASIVLLAVACLGVRLYRARANHDRSYIEEYRKSMEDGESTPLDLVRHTSFGSRTYNEEDIRALLNSRLTNISKVTIKKV